MSYERTNLQWLDPGIGQIPCLVSTKNVAKATKIINSTYRVIDSTHKSKVNESRGPDAQKASREATPHVQVQCRVIGHIGLSFGGWPLYWPCSMGQAVASYLVPIFELCWPFSFSCVCVVISKVVMS